jgi:hypothetical protein
MMKRCSGLYLFPGQTNGRPRERFYAGDFGAAVLDANILRREAKDAGRSLADPDQAIQVGWTDSDGNPHDARIEIVTTLHPLYRVRWWLRCPRCGMPRIRLYVARRGPACRCCLGLGYQRRKNDRAE